MAAVFSQLDHTARSRAGWEMETLAAVARFGALGEEEEASRRQGCKLIPGLRQIPGELDQPLNPQPEPKKTSICTCRSEPKLTCEETHSQEPRERPPFLLVKITAWNQLSLPSAHASTGTTFHSGCVLALQWAHESPGKENPINKDSVRLQLWPKSGACLQSKPSPRAAGLPCTPFMPAAAAVPGSYCQGTCRLGDSRAASKGLISNCDCPFPAHPGG